VAYRSQSKRLSRPSVLALFGAALGAPLIAGCQSNAQQDLVAREMRMQEDQIYALEDYLAEYQQLLCKMRAENAALRQQLADDDGIDEELPQRPSRPRTEGPAIEAPATPGIDVPPPEIELPDVPPLEETSSSDAELEFESAADGDAVLAAGEFADDAMFATPAAASEPTIPQPVIREVWLHGEVVENDSGGGPRLIVEIEPFDINKLPATFAGSLSLMLLAPGGDGGRENLARWDFAPKEVQAALADAADDGKIRFHLELAPDMPITESTQLWVRLLPQNGDKLLASADIDLHEPGFFSSFRPAPPQFDQSEQHPVVALATTTSPSTGSQTPVELSDAGWSIARPGEPANSGNDSSDSGEWRASDEPPPIAVAHSTPAKAQRRAGRPVPHPKKPRTAATPTGRPAGWSPDRPRDLPAANRRMATSSARPSWSANR
jgi:hypothetical protein